MVRGLCRVHMRNISRASQAHIHLKRCKRMNTMVSCIFTFLFLILISPRPFLPSKIRNPLQYTHTHTHTHTLSLSLFWHLGLRFISHAACGPAGRPYKSFRTITMSTQMAEHTVHTSFLNAWKLSVAETKRNTVGRSRRGQKKSKRKE